MSNRQLTLREARRAAVLLSGDTNDLRLFGMGTRTWHALGIRILGGTAIEVTRDPRARFFIQVVARTLRNEGHEIGTVVDPFLGSGNVLFHFARETGAPRAVGIELDEDIVRRRRRNFDVIRRWRRLPRTKTEIVAGNWSRCPSTSPRFAAVRTHPEIVRESVDPVIARYRAFEIARSDDAAVASRLDDLLVQLR